VQLEAENEYLLARALAVEAALGHVKAVQVARPPRLQT
jgi:hypothetical protein